MVKSSSAARDELSRRGFLAMGVASLAAFPAAASAIPPSEWLQYEARLRARLSDAGGGVFARDLAEALLDLSNAARDEVGAPPCAWSSELALAASAHAADLAQRRYIGHVSPEGFHPSDRVGVLARRMIGAASENIAYRRGPETPTAEAMMAIWRRSPPHWSNLLDPAHSHAGFGVATDGEHTYAVALYGRPNGELGAPVPFRLTGEADLARAVLRASPHFDGFSLAPPGDARGWGSAAGSGRDLRPGVYQLRPERRVDARRYEVLWGPIFVKV